MSHHHAHEAPLVPPAALAILGSLLLITVLIVAAVRWSGLEIRHPDAPSVRVSSLRFLDLPDGSIDVRDGLLRVGPIDTTREADISIKSKLSGLLQSLPMFTQGRTVVGAMRINGDVELARVLHGREYWRPLGDVEGVVYPARPFMKPAMEWAVSTGRIAKAFEGAFRTTSSSSAGSFSGCFFLGKRPRRMLMP